MAYLLKYNDVTLPATMRPNGGESPIDLGESERPRADGSIIQPGRRKSWLLTVKGDITADTMDDLNTAVDALRASLAPAQGGILYFGRDDRYAVGQTETFTYDTADGMWWGVVATISIGFRIPNPFWLATGPTTDALTDAGGTVTPAGDAPTLPAWSITIGTGGAGTVTLTNSTTGETATLSGTFAGGDVIVASRSGYTVTWNGTPAFGLLSGRIPMLLKGANVIVASAVTVTIADLSVGYTAQWE